MAQFQSRQKIVEAIQWKSGVFHAGIIETPRGGVYAYTASGKVALSFGDYVIGSTPGKLVVMGAADFEAAYEPVEPPKKAKPKKATPATTKKKTGKKKASQKKASKKK